MDRTRMVALLMVGIGLCGCSSSSTADADPATLDQGVTDASADLPADLSADLRAELPADIPLPLDDLVAETSGNDTPPADALVADAPGDTPEPDVACVPQCAGRECGDNGCGDPCGSCPGACNDGIWFAGECTDGQCTSGTTAMPCDDGSICTTDACDAATGCQHSPTNFGALCGPPECLGMTWTSGATCAEDGQCNGIGNQAVCTDALDCTDDACDPEDLCLHAVQAGHCAIDGACFADGDGHPQDPCLFCDAASVARSWSARGEGLECGVGGHCRSGACCVTDCAGKNCGSDGCGSLCGTCDIGLACLDGSCVANDCPAGYVRLAAGEFDMGSPVEEFGRGPADETLHHVTLTRDLCVKVTEVTQAEFKAATGEEPSYWTGCDDCPAEQVSWWDALAYCNQLSTLQGLAPCYVLEGCEGTPLPHTCTGVTFSGLDCPGYRLPTESEWEFAARAGTTGSTYNGNLDAAHAYCQVPNPVAEPIGWYNANACDTPSTEMCDFIPGCKRHPVKGKMANAWGLYDMLGNLAEWTWDWEGAYPVSPVTDPLGPDTGAERVIRGGAYDSHAAGIRCATRSTAAPAARYVFLGFRAVRKAP